MIHAAFPIWSLCMCVRIMNSSVLTPCLFRKAFAAEGLGFPVSIRPYFLFPAESTFSSRTQRPCRWASAEETYAVSRFFSAPEISFVETTACTCCAGIAKTKQITRRRAMILRIYSGIGFLLRLDLPLCRAVKGVVIRCYTCSAILSVLKKSSHERDYVMLAAGCPPVCKGNRSREQTLGACPRRSLSGRKTPNRLSDPYKTAARISCRALWPSVPERLCCRP